MRIFYDQLNRKLALKATPLRIVSLVPSQTELLIDLGLRDQVVGITKFCVHPKELRRQKEVVGGTKQVHLEKIRSLDPDLILCNKEENTEHMVQDLEQIAPVHVSDIANLSDALQMIRQYGEIFEVRERAAHIANEISRLEKDFQQELEHQASIKVAYFIWKKPWMVAGGETFINYLLQLNNFENVFANESGRYPEVSLEQLEAKGVELVLLSTEPFPFKDGEKESFSEYRLDHRTIIVDGEYFSWYGSRLVAAFEYFRKLQQKIQGLA